MHSTSATWAGVLSPSEAPDWATYRALCDAGDVLSRWLVERTVELLEDAGEGVLAARVGAVIEGPVLARPVDHRGGVEADFFQARLAYADVCAVAMRVAALATNPSVRLRTGRGLGGLPEAWAEYRDWIDGTHPRSPSTNAEGGQ